MSELNNIGKVPGKIGQTPEIQEKKEDLNQYPTQNETQAANSGISAGASVIGRSMVSADGINEDIAFGIKNQKAIEASDAFFDEAYALLSEANDPQAYEKASLLASAFAKEISQ